jgi:hypothetical protein
MPLNDLQQQVASVVLQAAKQHGFALAGGCALIVHGVVDRRTEDVDLFTDRAGGVEAAVAAVEASLEAAGFQVGREDKTAGLADVFPGMGEGRSSRWAAGRRSVTTSTLLRRSAGATTSPS